VTAAASLRLLAGASALLVLASCGGTGAPDVLAQAGQSLSRVRSGTMDLRMTVNGGDGGQAGQIGFEERGPFSLPAAGALPVAHTDVVHFVGTQQDATTFISTGKNAYISTGGHTYSLPPARLEQLRKASVTSSNSNGLASLQVDRWAAGASTGDGGTVDGVATDHVAANVNVRVFLNDLMQLTRSLGETASVPQVTDADAQDLGRIVKSGRLELWAGRDDHLIRKLTVGIDFAAPSGAQLSGALARYSQTHLDLSLTLSGVNQSVSVPEPAAAEPFSAFCKQQPDAAACKSTQ
jgi:hypothetical protein